MRALTFVAIAAIGLGEARAQPVSPTSPDAPPQAAPASQAQPADLARAAELFEAANQAMTDGRYADAARDYTAAYEISRDPVVFFKIGSAHDKAGACDVALTWYRRYLDEAKPEEKFAKLAQERIDACKPIVEPIPETTKPAEPEAPAELPVAPVLATSKKKDTAWLLVGGALTFVTAGVVLAYSANSSEQDLRDLYVSNNGKPPRFDDNTQKRYDDLVSEGERFEHLSWAAFGLAGGCAIAATVLFLKQESPVTVAPVVTPKETGVSAMVRF
ncbi:MAG: hypothetical protein HOV81_10505 [Kofleriaceae bacterium]|nr:hypothetical protein [Kofleriaceae bacterium]